MGHYCDNRKALGSYIIIMAHVGFPSRRFPDMQAVFLRRFLKSLCLTGCLALVVRPCLKSSLFSLSSSPLPCLQVSATDEDRGSFGAITYSLGAGAGSAPPSLFAIEKESGQLCTRATLDRDEGLDKFDLVVTATDGVGTPRGLKSKGWKSLISRRLFVCTLEKHIILKGKMFWPVCSSLLPNDTQRA